MEISIRESDQIWIVYLNGRLDTSTSMIAETALGQLMEAGSDSILINLGGIEYISSSGLRVLLVTAKKILASKGKLIICKPNDVVREILDMSGFSTILTVRESEEEALAEFQL